MAKKQKIEHIKFSLGKDNLCNLVNIEIGHTKIVSVNTIEDLKCLASSTIEYLEITPDNRVYEHVTDEQKLTYKIKRVA